ncbi:nucleoside-diphosphate-sugar epimerase [Friedmanniella endophytica]|uniref:Nucleoside-diphosphate-sugar epimerase n=1 Tax=Microlunatus kandeliicorticis TaxID=1759536 RepID=A0A7W3ISG7_9ACTN|nr:NAD-dependent epimerase/dehydratase family protein [Microlunatus kandeliicorticis]MBA8794406.1 nucleoside-diphosphate-sugar epimerase [Microlunatus kandeliicorticis]
MSKHVIVGSGPVGRHTARLLVQAGHEVVLVSRSGRGPEIAGARRVAVDAADRAALGSVTAGAAALYNCANPPHYGNWEQVWPALSAGLLGAAEQTGATLVTTSSLYGYGPVDVPMTEALPDVATEKNGRIRAEMWATAKAAHEAGRARVVEVRASDYAGAGLADNSHLYRNVPAALAGRRAMVVGDPDLPHSWTDVLDVARTLVAVAERPETWGRVWLAPTNAPRTHRQALADVLAAGGHPMVPMSGYPKPVLAALALANADMRQLRAMRYVFTRPYVVDSTAAETELGLAPTPWDEVCRRTLFEPAQPTGRE